MGAGASTSKGNEGATVQKYIAPDWMEMDLNFVVKEVLKCYHPDMDGFITKDCYLETCEAITDILEESFGFKERKQAIQWFKNAGANGDPACLVLHKDQWCQQFVTTSCEQSGIPEDQTGKLATWIWFSYGKRLVEKFYPGSTKPCWNGMETIALYNDHREVVKFKCNAKPNLSFQEPVFFCPHGRLCDKQRQAQPMLFICVTDWERVKHFWHREKVNDFAFGMLGASAEAEHEVLGHRKISANFVSGDYDPRGRDWVVVWTFPGDLNRLPGFNKICKTKLSVGRGTLTDDYWMVHRDKGYAYDDVVPKDALVEKFRRDMEKGSPIHSLEDSAGEKVAMISTSYFERSHLSGSIIDEEKLHVRRLLSALDAVGVFAFACYTAHRALVFYIDRSTGDRITPESFAQIIQQPERGQKIVDLLEEYAHDKEGLRSWRQNFIEFASGSLPVLTVHVEARENDVLSVPVSIRNLGGDEMYALQIDPSSSVAELRAIIVARQPQGQRTFDLLGQDGQVMQDSWLVSACAANEEA